MTGEQFVCPFLFCICRYSCSFMHVCHCLFTIPVVLLHDCKNYTKTSAIKVSPFYYLQIAPEWIKIASCPRVCLSHWGHTPSCVSHDDSAKRPHNKDHFIFVLNLNILPNQQLSKTDCRFESSVRKLIGLKFHSDWICGSIKKCESDFLDMFLQMSVAYEISVHLVFSCLKTTAP